MTSNRNRNVALTVLLDADRKGLILLTDEGQELHVGVGPNTGDTIRDWLLINERRQPKDEGPNVAWHEAEPTGRLATRSSTEEVEDYIAKGGKVTIVKKARKGFQPFTPEQKAASLRKKFETMSADERAALLALLTNEENANAD